MVILYALLRYNTNIKNTCFSVFFSIILLKSSLFFHFYNLKYFFIKYFLFLIVIIDYLCKFYRNFHFYAKFYGKYDTIITVKNKKNQTVGGFSI